MSGKTSSWTSTLARRTCSARRGTYRLLYEIDQQARTVLITAIESRGDAYRPH